MLERHGFFAAVRIIRARLADCALPNGGIDPVPRRGDRRRPLLRLTLGREGGDWTAVGAFQLLGGAYPEVGGMEFSVDGGPRPTLWFRLRAKRLATLVSSLPARLGPLLEDPRLEGVAGGAEPR